METRTFAGQIKSVDDFSREIEAVVSTEETDLYDEKILASGWDFSIFNKNPVLLLSHQYEKFPVGKAKKLWIEGGRLLARFIFHDITREAREAFALFKEGVLRGFSVDFLPGRSEEGPEGSGIKRIFTEGHRLLEISLMPLPANSDALAMAYRKGLICAKTYEALDAVDTVVNLEDLVALFDDDGIVSRAEEQQGFTQDELVEALRVVLPKFIEKIDSMIDERLDKARGLIRFPEA